LWRLLHRGSTSVCTQPCVILHLPWPCCQLLAPLGRQLAGHNQRVSCPKSMMVCSAPCGYLESRIGEQTYHK
jgi:hypothetical protein